MNIQRAHVTSSAIASVGYEPRSRILEVEFPSGNVYRYFDVPYSIYEDFRTADSKGRWFNQEVRDRFSHVLQHRRISSAETHSYAPSEERVK